MIVGGLLVAILILFVITLIVGYVYISRTDEQVDEIHATLNKVNASLNNFQANSNHRWNITFAAFERVVNDINKVSVELNLNQINNLNLTKFNRAALLDSNIMIHKLWENLTGTNPCENNPFANCVDTKNATSIKNITQLVTNYSASAGDIYAPKQSAPPRK